MMATFNGGLKGHTVCVRMCVCMLGDQPSFISATFISTSTMFSSTWLEISQVLERDFVLKKERKKNNQGRGAVVAPLYSLCFSACPELGDGVNQKPVNSCLEIENL